MPPIRRTVFALHGFTLAGAMFNELTTLVDAEVVAPDLPGHGGRGPEGTSWDEAVTEVSDLVERHRPDAVLGYSMGGRLALAATLDLDAPPPLVLVSVGIGIADSEARRSREAEDVALAARIEGVPIAEFVAAWGSHPVAGGYRSLDKIRLRSNPQGLAAALRGMGQGVQPDLSGRLGELRAATVWIAGSADEKYAAIARRAADESGGICVIAPGARHNVVKDAPETVAAEVNGLLG